MWSKVMRLLSGAVILSAALAFNTVYGQGGDTLYLPAVMKAQTSITGETYTQGIATQWDLDDPVRTAAQHADKNLGLRSYDVATTGNGSNFTPGLIDYGTDDNRGPQLAYLFNPPRVPSFPNFYRVHNWNWATSPNPGSQGGLLDTCPPASSPNCVNWPITAIGMGVTPGERIHAPRTGVNNPIAPCCHMMVIYADANNIALKYTVEDTAVTGYTVHIRNITVDTNLLALYNSLNNSARDTFMFRGSQHYNLPYLASGQAIGFATGNEIVVAIVDTGSFMDPRSCNEWWLGFTNGSTCPQRDGNIIR